LHGDQGARVGDLVGGGLKLSADGVEDLVGCAGFQLAVPSGSCWSVQPPGAPWKVFSQ